MDTELLYFSSSHDVKHACLEFSKPIWYFLRVNVFNIYGSSISTRNEATSKQNNGVTTNRISPDTRLLQHIFATVNKSSSTLYLRVLHEFTGAEII